MRRKISHIGLMVFIIAGMLLMIQGCANEPVVREDVTRTPGGTAVQKPAAPPADTGELARLGKTVSNEATPPTGEKAGRLGYFVVHTPNGDYVFYDVHFDFDKYSIRAEDRDALSRYAKWFKDNPKYTAVIEGYCDDRGTEEYNLALGQRRADATGKFLTDMGVGAARIKTVSYGEEFPLDPSQTEEAYAKNRRAHFVVSLGK